MSITQLPGLDAADVAYVTGRFVPLDLLANAYGWNAEALHEAMNGRRVPQPAYVLADGTEMVAADFFTLLGDGSELDTLRERFVRRYESALERLGMTRSNEDSTETWDSFLSGLYAVCIKSVSPEAIALKHALVASIEALLAASRPGDATWRTALRDAVTRLDALETPFAAWDTVRFGRRPTRERLINDVRAHYPDVFED